MGMEDVIVIFLPQDDGGHESWFILLCSRNPLKELNRHQ